MTPGAPPPWWLPLAACTGEDPEIFFNAFQPHEAKAVCGRCPVRDLCLAAYYDEPYGIFGGLTPRERRKEENS